MSKHDSLYFYFVIVTLFLSCGNEKTELIEKTKLYKDVSEFVDKEQYYLVYKKANDSLKSWVKHELSVYLGNDPWQIDSLLCFNNSFDRCVMAVGDQCVNSCVQDYLRFYYGAKIKEQWYFFFGATVVLPREFYQKDIHTPLSFEKMHEIAMEEIFSGYLMKDEKGKWQINEKFFEDMVNKNANLPGYGGCIECKTEEEYFLHLSKLNWLPKHTVLREDEVEMSYNESLKLLKLRFPLKPFTEHIVPWKVVTKMYKESDPSNMILNHIQSPTNFEETGFMGEMVFKDIHPSDILTFNIEFFFRDSANESTKPLVLTKSVSNVMREPNPPI